MTSFSVSFDDKAAQAMLGRVGGVPGEKAMRAASLAAKQLVFNAFRFSAAPDGSAWLPLSPLTLASRKHKGNSSIQPLIATGAMYKSVEAANTATEASVTIGEGLPDARSWYSQFGTLRNPARAMLPISTMGAANPTQAWLDTVSKPINDAMREAAAA